MVFRRLVKWVLGLFRFREELLRPHFLDRQWDEWWLVGT